MKKSKLVGILTLVSGMIGIIIGAWYVITFNSLVALTGNPLSAVNTFVNMEHITYIGLGIWHIILGITAIICGLLVIRQIQPRWVLAGSIASAMAFIPTGMTAVLVLLLTKNDILNVSGFISES